MAMVSCYEEEERLDGLGMEPEPKPDPAFTAFIRAGNSPLDWRPKREQVIAPGMMLKAIIDAVVEKRPFTVSRGYRKGMLVA